MLASDVRECRRLVIDLRKTLMRIDHDKVMLKENSKQENLDTEAFKYMIKDRITCTILADGETYKTCKDLINRKFKDLRNLGDAVVAIIKYLKKQILGLAGLP